MRGGMHSSHHHRGTGSPNPAAVEGSFIGLGCTGIGSHRFALRALRCLAFATVLLVPTLAHAEVRYTVQPSGDNSQFKVTMRFHAGPGVVELRSPNWSPGDYTLKN